MSDLEKPSNAFEDVTFGSIAGMTAKLFEHPFDLVKVRLQSQSTDRPLRFTGPVDCFRQTYNKEGWKGLYRGISAPLVGAACENATLFLAYNRFQKVILTLRPDGLGVSEKALGKRRELSVGEVGLAGAGAGFVASFVLTPIELIKCRMQVQMLAREGAFGSASLPTTSSTASSSRSFHTSLPRPNFHAPPPNLPPPLGPFQLILSTIRQSGFRGLWLGQTGTLLRETGGSSAWFTTYELVSRYLLLTNHSHQPTPTKSNLSAWELMFSGACAGVAYNVILFPADSIKSAMQTWGELHPDRPRLGFGEMGKRIWKTRGLKGLYAGCGLTCLRAAPSSAMIFYIFETLQTRFGGILG